MEPVPSPRARAVRLDQFLVDQGLCETREKAKRSILAGLVRINDQRADKASRLVSAKDQVVVAEPERYVSRGGHKLEHALTTFNIQPQGWSVIDLGASTGGFTDCLLQHGASRVAAVDVGHGQLAWKLRNDPRVCCLEKTNARHLTLASMPAEFHRCELAVIDCSFISLKLILPVALNLVAEGGRIVALIKPQFEAGKEEVDRGEGVIRDPLIHERVLAELREFADRIPSTRWQAVTESPLLGPAGNKEFLVLIEKKL